MYLSRIELDPQNRNTMRALNWPVVMHGAIECSFNNKAERKLWRVDYLQNRCYLLVLSESKPDFAKLREQFCKENVPWETRDYQPLIDRVENGQKYRFRLCANPVHCTKNAVGLKDRTDRGRIRAHVTLDQQCLWLIEKAEHCGFTVDKGEPFTHTDSKGIVNTYWTHPGFEVVHTTWKKFNKNNNDRSRKNQVTLRTATYEGILTITDAKLFREKLMRGIGREKAYGCGLLTIIRIKDG